MGLTLKLSQPQTKKEDLRVRPTPVKVIVEQDVLDRKKSMDYELAKRIFAGEITEVTIETSLK